MWKPRRMIFCCQYSIGLHNTPLVLSPLDTGIISFRFDPVTYIVTKFTLYLKSHGRLGSNDGLASSSISSLSFFAHLLPFFLPLLPPCLHILHHRSHIVVKIIAHTHPVMWGVYLRPCGRASFILVLVWLGIKRKIIRWCAGSLVVRHCWCVVGFLGRAMLY